MQKSINLDNAGCKTWVSQIKGRTEIGGAGRQSPKINIWTKETECNEKLLNAAKWDHNLCALH